MGGPASVPTASGGSRINSERNRSRVTQHQPVVRVGRDRRAACVHCRRDVEVGLVPAPHQPHLARPGRGPRCRAAASARPEPASLLWAAPGRNEAAKVSPKLALAWASASHSRSAYCGPMPGNNCTTRKNRQAVLGIFRPTKQESASFTCAASKKRRPPYLTKGILRRCSSTSSASLWWGGGGGGGGGRAEQHGLLPERNPSLALFENSICYPVHLRRPRRPTVTKPGRAPPRRLVKRSLVKRSLASPITALAACRIAWVDR